MGVNAIWQTVMGLDKLVLASGLALAHLALSLGVTLHALLSKRDIAATIGWIGLAWLSPFLGPALYWMFGINRVSQRARALGFASSWLTEWYAYDARVLERLGLAAHEKIAGFVHIGRAAAVPEDRVRPVMDEIVTRY